MAARAPLRRIAFLTDVEGHIGHLRRYVRRSKVLKPCARAPGGVDFRDPSGADGFVYGGDACDHGDGDLAVLDALLGLKERYPDRVWFLIGNRDGNKMRFTSELDAAELARPAADARLGGPYWLQSAHWRERLSLNAYTERMAAAHRRSAGRADEGGGGALDFVPRSMRPSALAASLTHRCKWMLANTMGSPNAFAHRQAELSSRGFAKNDEEATARSFLHESLAPDGRVRRYLEHAQLALVLHDALFVHGAVTADALGYVPPPPATEHAGDADAHAGDAAASPSERWARWEAEAAGNSAAAAARPVEAWVDALNAWARDEVAAWTRDPTYPDDDDGDGTDGTDGDGYRGPRRAGAGLMDYVLPGGAGGRGVVYSTWLGAQGRPAAIPRAVSTALGASGINFVLSGHQPHGDAPLTIQAAAPGGGAAAGLTVVTGDTSYSDASTPDKRGTAVGEVLLTFPPAADDGARSRSACRLHGVLSADAEEYDCDVAATPSCPVGRSTTDGRHVKLRLSDGNFLLTAPRKQEGGHPSDQVSTREPPARVMELLWGEQSVSSTSAC